MSAANWLVVDGVLSGTFAGVCCVDSMPSVGVVDGLVVNDGLPLMQSRAPSLLNWPTTGPVIRSASLHVTLAQLLVAIGPVSVFFLLLLLLVSFVLAAGGLFRAALPLLGRLRRRP